MVFKTQNASRMIEYLKQSYMFNYTVLLIGIPIMGILWFFLPFQFGGDLRFFRWFMLIIMVVYALSPVILAYGYKRLSFVVMDRGLLINFIGKTYIPWSKIKSLDIIDHPSWGIIPCRGAYQIGDLAYGLFGVGKNYPVRVWLAGESRALLVRTAAKGYMIAPEELDEFKSLIDAKLKE